jgi:CheY-like chemotaxis protein
MKLLIVEDEKDIRDSYAKQIKLYNHDHPEFILKADYAKDYSEAEESLGFDYDAVILDLKLSKTNVQYEGKSLLEEIKSNLRYVSYVITGNPEAIEEQKGDENAFFRIRVKGEANADFTVILNEISGIYKTGITKILGNSGVIEKYLNNIFWNHLSSSIDLWVKDEIRNGEQKEKSLLRYTLLHMQEYIDEEIEKYHPNEFYITKPVKKNIFTGDIINLRGSRYVVLTPSCDIVLREDGVRNTKKILFCKIISLNDVVENYSSLVKETSKNNPIRKRLNRYIQNNGKQNFHFIPKSTSIDAGFIDFQDNLTLPIGDVVSFLRTDEMERIATISLPFLKDIISRYSNYYARQGSPDFNIDEVYKSLF